MGSQITSINYAISCIASLFVSNASGMIQDSMMGNGLMSERTKEKLTQDIKNSDLFHDILEDNKPESVYQTGYSYGADEFLGFTDLHLGVGKFNYELKWTKSKFSVAGKETWEVKVRIWDTYNFDESSANFNSIVGALNFYGLTMQNANVFKPYYWELDFLYIYVVD